MFPSQDFHSPVTENRIPRLRRSLGTHTSAWNVTKQGMGVKILLIYQWCTGAPEGHVPEAGLVRFPAGKIFGSCARRSTIFPGSRDGCFQHAARCGSAF